MTMTTSRILLGAALVLASLAPQAARADVTLQQNQWDSVPRVQISRGVAESCEDNPVIYDGAMARGYSQSFTSSGDGGVSICFRRTIDPDDDTSALSDTWTRCAWNGECDIS